RVPPSPRRPEARLLRLATRDRRPRRAARLLLRRRPLPQRHPPGPVDGPNDRRRHPRPPPPPADGGNVAVQIQKCRQSRSPSMSVRLNDNEIQEKLKSATGWARDGHMIKKQYGFPSFPDGLAFLVRLGFECEQQDHHPDIAVDYKRVTLGYWTHSEGGITEKDFAGAETADRIAAGVLQKR